jgi:hypothetical protein
MKVSKLKFGRAVKSLLTASLFTVSTMSFAAAPPGGWNNGWRVVYADNFDTLDIGENKRWKFRGNAAPHFRPDNVSVQNGVLTIRNVMHGAVNTGGWIESNETFGNNADFDKYGYYEARLRITGDPKGKIWPTWWIWGGNSQGETTEIDIMELSGTSPFGLPTSSHHYRGKTPIGPKSSSDTYEDWRAHERNPFDGKFHDWGVLWTPDEISYYFDGKKYYTSNQPQDAAAETRPLRLIFSSSPHVRDGINGASNPSQADNPQKDPKLLPQIGETGLPSLQIEYVRVFQGGTAEPQPFVTLTKSNAPNYSIDGGNFAQLNTQAKLWFDNPNQKNQQWVEIDRGNGFFSYRKRFTSLCLDGGHQGARGQAVNLFYCGTDNKNQQWEKISLGGDKYRLRKNIPWADFYLDGGNGGAPGQGMKLWDATHPNQEWTIVSRPANGG